MKKLFLCFILFFGLSIQANSRQVDLRPVRVRILDEQKLVKIILQGNWTFAESGDGEVRLARGNYIASADTGAIYLASEGDTLFYAFTTVLKINPINTGAKIGINTRIYRGCIQINRNERNNLEIINVLNLEDYLRGVIKNEISPFWNEEAIKAQILASRTYALMQMEKNEQRPFDLVASVLSQVYRGVDSEDSLIDALIRQTEGEYIAYKGRPIEAYFHACCGGHTEEMKNIWQTNHSYPYLPSQVDYFCKNSPHFQWRKEFGLAEIERTLNRAGHNIEGVYRINVQGRTKSGRAKEIHIFHRKGRMVVSAVELRKILGYDVLRSTLFHLFQTGKKIVLEGKGWGHGVGMCQWGAKEMAERGYSYQRILQFYYPGTSMEKMKIDE